MLPLNSLFPSIHDIETVVLRLLFILFFWMCFSYLVTTGWGFEISLCENSISHQSIGLVNAWVGRISRRPGCVDVVAAAAGRLLKKC